ncbi:unannotated protein [freshwater metagenome]|uniref:Unannotated protein n=1 Tax=freshwater metagenome TaxID=449393 RepID=A0A6J7EK67_9ZZZZ|nr:DUF1425 domain-containing protein [Actinomycetota bacterium]
MKSLSPYILLKGIVPVISLLLAFGLSVNEAGAQSMASKIEKLGEMTYLEVADLRIAQRNGLLNVQVEIKNTSNSNEQLYYRFKWLDSSGFSVWNDEPWKPLLIYGKQKQLITTVAPTLQATDFRVVLQSPNN